MWFSRTLTNQEISLDDVLGDPRLFGERFGIRDFIIFVGHIEPMKNLLKLLQAFIKSESDTSRAVFLPPPIHNSPRLAPTYKAAHSVVLPSWKSQDSLPWKVH